MSYSMLSAVALALDDERHLGSTPQQAEFRASAQSARWLSAFALRSMLPTPYYNDSAELIPSIVLSAGGSSFFGDTSFWRTARVSRKIVLSTPFVLNPMAGRLAIAREDNPVR
jgi:hypothetical protein